MSHELSSHELKSEIVKIRRALREHRDQVGDYRCWVDDEVLHHATLPELRQAVPRLPDFEEFAANCHAYHTLRQNPADQDQTSIPLDSSVGPLPLQYSEELDADLQGMSREALMSELASLLQGIRAHQRMPCNERTYYEDIALSQLLPEKTLPQTKLPPYAAFVETNCPAYNRHCQAFPEDFIRGIWSRID